MAKTLKFLILNLLYSLLMSEAKRKTVTDGFVTEKLYVSTNVPVGMIEIPACSKSEVYHTKNHTYETMATA